MQENVKGLPQENLLKNPLPTTSHKLPLGLSSHLARDEAQSPQGLTVHLLSEGRLDYVGPNVS